MGDTICVLGGPCFGDKGRPHHGNSRGLDNQYQSIREVPGLMAAPRILRVFGCAWVLGVLGPYKGILAVLGLLGALVVFGVTNCTRGAKGCTRGTIGVSQGLSGVL